VRLALVTLVLVGALVLVAWRQGRALEALAALDQVRQERALAEAERDEMERRIEQLESRQRVGAAARTRLQMHTPDVSETRLLQGDME
jgi:cell division protein FtsL